MSYMVMVEGREALKKRHATYADAAQEAKRLLAQEGNKGRKALILKIEEEIEASKDTLLLTEAERGQILSSYGGGTIRRQAENVARAQLRKVIRSAEKAWGPSSISDTSDAILARAYQWLREAQKEAGL